MARYHNLGAKIIDAREKVGMTQRTLCKLTGIPQPTMSRLEAGENKNVNFKHVKLICSQLNISESDLVDFEDINKRLTVTLSLNIETFEQFKKCIAEVHEHVKFMAVDSDTSLENFPVDRLAALYYRKILLDGNDEIFTDEINTGVKKLQEGKELEPREDHIT